MSDKLLTEQNLEFLSLKGGCTGSSELHLSKCHIDGNHMSRLICQVYSIERVDGPFIPTSFQSSLLFGKKTIYELKVKERHEFVVYCLIHPWCQCQVVEFLKKKCRV